jgi:hypothetical protein
VRTWNPIKINFVHLWLLIKDAWRARRWQDKLRIWFMPTGWRPADVAERYPLYKIANVYHFDKYDTPGAVLLHAWYWIQLSIMLLLISYLFGNIASIGSPGIFIYGGFVFLSVYSYTELMDGNRYSLVWEAVKNAMGLGIIFYYGSWFGAAGRIGSWVDYALGAWFIFSTVFTAYIVFRRLPRRQAAPVPM